MLKGIVVRTIVFLLVLLVILPMGASLRKKRVVAKPDTIPLVERISRRVLLKEQVRTCHL